MNRSLDQRVVRGTRSIVTLLLVVLMVVPAVADEYGRYRAIVLHEGGRSGQSGSFLPKVFIIDSREGHMWTWEQKTKLQDPKGSFALGSVLTYQGRVHPGEKMGEIIEQAVGR